MTQVALLKSAEIPSKEKIQNHLVKLGYDFKFTDHGEPFYGASNIECTINNCPTSFELYFEEAKGILKEWTWLPPPQSEPDTIIFFVWDSDFAAAACIGLICIALIDFSAANIFYLEEEMPYSREMLINDTPHYLYELEKLLPNFSDNDEEKSFESFQKYKWWQKLLKWFK